MAGNCDGYFDNTGIEFLPSYEDQAIYFVRSDPNLIYYEKKELILCWYDTTFGQWNGSRFDLGESRRRMSSWLKNNNYQTFEELLEE